LEVFIIWIAAGLPGNLVLWAYTIHKVQQQTGNKMVTLGELIDNFPHSHIGFPNKDGISEIWDFQKAYVHKLPGDNLIDLRETWYA